jgi:hypothetical protein
MVTFDEVRLLADRVVNVRGWAASRDGEPVELRIGIGDDRDRPTARIRRPDVPAARSKVRSDHVGFAASGSWPAGHRRRTPMTFEVRDARGGWSAQAHVTWSPRSG